MLNFPDRENRGNLPKKKFKIGFYTGHLPPTQGNFWKCPKLKAMPGFGFLKQNLNKWTTH